MVTVIKDKNKSRERRLEFDESRLLNFIDLVIGDTELPQDSVKEFKDQIIRLISYREEIESKEITQMLLVHTKELVPEIKDEDDHVTPDSLKNIGWNSVARKILQLELYKRASKNRSYPSSDKYGSYPGLVVTLVEKGLYTQDLLEKYTEEELNQIGKLIVPERDELFDYAGLQSLADRYIVKNFDKSILELPQERFLTIAAHLMIDEPKDIRIKLIEEAYWSLSNLYITVATPTLTNAGRPAGGLSSCFVLTTEDSLQGIFDDNTDIATFSKWGGGIGAYMGKIRGKGSAIRGFKGASSGVIPWIKQLDNTSVSVDQLGQRAGAVAVYLDAWHSDIEDFTDLRLNTGDASRRAYNVFTGMCIPDEFMRQVDARGDWYLFDPHEIREVMGFNLEDYYDLKKLKHNEKPDPDLHAWTYRYYQCVDSNELSKKRIPAINLMKKIMRSQLETGIPFMFYRDTVNRDNPNKHAGMIYSSNLCTEIDQNMSASTVVQKEINWADGTVIIQKQIGDLVTCNLSSLVVNRVIPANVLERAVAIQVRMLDNVISLQRVAVEQAQYTNLKYRAIGAGEQGRAALLALEQIQWDSQEAVEYVNKLEEEIMMYTIKHSALLGIERGSYEVYEGSDWNTGEWFNSRDLTLPEWEEVKQLAMTAMRNAYLRAVAPTGGTSIIAGSTPGNDPIFDIIYQEKKRNFQAPIVVPGLNIRTWFYYKPTLRMEYDGEREIAHMWSILMNEKTQKWVDQGVSHNLYVPQNISAAGILRLHLENWDRNVKTSYYVRSWDQKHESSCLSCSA